MIPSTLIQGLSANILSDGLSSGKGDSGRSDGFATLLGGLTQGGETGGAEGASGKRLPGGQSFLTQLKKAFMASGQSLEDYPADDAAVSEFAGILLKLGFSSDEVGEMVSNFNARAVGNDATLADLFKAASQLSEPDPEGGAAVMLDLSALPDLGSILGQLGLDLKTGREILSDALVEGVGIDLSRLAAGIRQAMGDMKEGSQAAIEDPSDVLEKLQRLGLYSEEGASLQMGLEALDAAGALSYLEKHAAGDEAGVLQKLMASAWKQHGEPGDGALLAKLAQMNQAAGSAAQAAGMTETGDISLERFAAILESRVAEAEGLRGANGGSSAGRLAEMVSGLKEKALPTTESASQQGVSRVDLEGGEPFREKWQPGNTRFSNSEAGRRAVTSASDTAGKETAGQNALQASKQTGTMAAAQQQIGAANTSGAASETVNTAVKDKASQIAEDFRLGADGLVREARAGSEAASFGKTAAGKNLPGYLLDQVSRQIVRLRNAGENEMTLQLKPPHLGRMKLNIEHTSGGIKVGIVVESAAARDMLLSNSHDLKTALADQGLRLDRIDVEAQADFGQSMAQAGRGFGQSGGRKGRWGGGHRPDGSGSSASPVEETPGTAGGGDPGRLDLVA